MIRGPGIPAGAVSDELVSLTDLPQTILEIATGSTDPSLDGRSLLPYAQNPVAALDSPDPARGRHRPGQRQRRLRSGLAASLARTATAKARLAGSEGVKNLDQEKDPIRR